MPSLLCSLGLGGLGSGFRASGLGQAPCIAKYKPSCTGHALRIASDYVDFDTLPEPYHLGSALAVYVPETGKVRVSKKDQEQRGRVSKPAGHKSSTPESRSEKLRAIVGGIPARHSKHQDIAPGNVV